MAIADAHKEMQPYLQRIADSCGPHAPVRVMEVCGTHTVALFRSGIRSLLPGGLRLISGPGCPVCVTTQGYVDAACQAAQLPDTTICTYGDMVRVPGRLGSLEGLRGRGAEVMVVYSAREALKYAREHRDRRVVFLAVGFETTAPATAAACIEAEEAGLENFCVLNGHKLVMPALKHLLAAGALAVDALLCPGHVSVITGSDAFVELAEPYGVPCVITGFEPAQMVHAIAKAVELAAAGRGKVFNAYSVVVRPEGNRAAMDLIAEVFEPVDAEWRAMGTLPASGLAFAERFARFDAAAELDLEVGGDYEPPGCLCGQVIQGKAEPGDCPLFAGTCTPYQPVGPCMVSSEGTCAAWYKYGPRR